MISPPYSSSISVLFYIFFPFISLILTNYLSRNLLYFRISSSLTSLLSILPSLPFYACLLSPHQFFLNFPHTLSYQSSSIKALTRFQPSIASPFRLISSSSLLFLTLTHGIEGPSSSGLHRDSNTDRHWVGE
jgi:hypothetical protein